MAALCASSPSFAAAAAAAAAASASASAERSVALLTSSRRRRRLSCCNAAAAASNSSSDPLRSDLWKTSGGYHPLEELSSSEKEDIDKTRGGKLSHGETARTIAEVNTSAILLSPSLTHSNSVFGTEVTYLVDEHGEIFFELADDNAVLQNSFVDPTCSFLIGFGDISELLTSELLPVYESHLVAEADKEDDSDYEDDDDDEDEDLFTSDDTDSSEDNEVVFEHTDAPPTPHPMLFASKLSKVAGCNIFQNIYKPSLRIALTGYVRSVNREEEPYVRRKWEDRYLWEEDGSSEEKSEVEEDEDGEQEKNDDEEGATTAADDSDSLLSEDESWSDGSEAGTSFYKFEIQTIQLSSIIGAHADVDVKEFRYSEPDVLAHSAPDIVRNATGKKLKKALKALCLKEKGLAVDEASIIGVDSLGVDVRASCGVELKTLRFPFLRRARCADTAQLLLHQVLYPRSRHRKAL